MPSAEILMTCGRKSTFLHYTSVNLRARFAINVLLSIRNTTLNVITSQRILIFRIIVAKREKITLTVLNSVCNN